MRILMLAWRDMNHPKMGGAEIVTDIYLKGLVGLGHEVTLFSADYPGAKETEEMNGYSVVRKGSQLSVCYHGLKYAKKHEKEYDVIIDQVNTIPFFTPLAISRKKRVAFFHQLCREIWFYESRFPVSLVGYALEYLYLKLYRDTRMFVVSESTKQDLVRYAWAKPEDIIVLENQIDFKPVSEVSGKGDYFVFVGRLTKSKRVHDCIKALSEVKDSKLYVIGDGDEKYKEELNNLVSRLGLDGRVIFTGKVPSSERNELMSKATAILVTSVREGWGLIVTEANANGTIAITYDIPGVRDANKTGFVCERNNPVELARLMDEAKSDKEELEKRSKKSLEFAQAHTNWNENIRRLEKWLRNNR